jgi:hypothetical protein
MLGLTQRLPFFSGPLNRLLELIININPRVGLLPRVEVLPLFLLLRLLLVLIDKLIDVALLVGGELRDDLAEERPR